MKINLIWLKYVIGILGIYKLMLLSPAFITSFNLRLGNPGYVPWVLMGLLIISWIILSLLLVKLKLIFFRYLLVIISFVGIGLSLYTTYILQPNSGSSVDMISNILVGVTMINIMVDPVLLTKKLVHHPEKAIADEKGGIKGQK
jgi:hypothetical protein